MKSAYRCMSAVVLMSTLISPMAQAHTPYLVPSAFEPVNGGLVTLDASFATHFFTPEVFFTDGSDFQVTDPTGDSKRPDTVIAIESRNIVEHDLVDDGTYKFSTGRRMGRVFKVYMLDGERHSMEDPEEEIPEGGRLIDFYQSNTMAETYVTRGGPSEGALVARGDGLEYLAITNPNDLFVGEALKLQALYYGKPLSDLEIEVFPSTSDSSDDHPVLVLNSGPDGEIEFTPQEAGVYLLRSRHRDTAPEGSAAPEYSHTYTLVVEAFE